jgi:hypothetical protein
MVRTCGAIGLGSGTTADFVDAGSLAVGRALSARSASELKRRLAGLLHDRRDHVIDALVDRAASAGDSLRLRRTAETAAATLCTKRGGIAARLSLFIVAIVLVFDDEMPGTQVDPLLRETLRTRSVRSQIDVAARTGDGEDVSLLGEVFELEALARLPLSAIHRAAVAMRDGNFEVARHCLGVDVERPARRSGAFARFLVGRRTGFEKSAVTGEQLLRSPAKRIADAMRDRMSVPVRVSACVDGRFFDGLFAGMWRYQDARIGQVASQAIGRLDGGGVLSARAETYGSASSHGVGLSLHCDRIEGSLCRCRIAGRPGAPIDETLRRVVGALRKAGIAAIEEVRCDGGSTGVGGGGCLCHGRSAFSVAI